MAVTAQQIAELAGVSRGTVDRALHNRGRVTPEVAAKIHKIAAELGYKPNLIGQALVKSRREFKLGAILQSTETPTMQYRACRRAARRRGACRLGRGTDHARKPRAWIPKWCLNTLKSWFHRACRDWLSRRTTRRRSRQCIDELYEQGIPVITLNSDAPGSRRLAFIGMGNYRAGQTAAGLLRLMLPEGGKVLPLAGHLNNTAHNNRLNGFMDTINSETGNEIELLAFQPCFDRDDYAHEITQHALRANPDLTGIYVASNGQVGACAAVEEEGRKGKVKVVAFDLNPMNMELLQSDSLSFVLDQKAFEQQGYRPPFLLFDYLQNKKTPEKRNCFIRILQSKPSLTAINLWEWNKKRTAHCAVLFNGKLRMENEYGDLALKCDLMLCKQPQIRWSSVLL